MNDALGNTGRYTLIRRLGRGGMAEVYLARTKGLEDFQRDYAIKRLLPQFVDDRRVLRMFLDEARITVALQHPNIVQVFDLGGARGNYYIVMEYVDGMDLRRLLTACSRAQTIFPYKHTLYVITESLKGLNYAHRAAAEDGSPLNVVHQDISPANIMVSRGGAVKLMDFGVARAAIAKWERDPAEILGKYRYFAPELVRGGQASPRSDVFAVGAVLYELVTGESLLEGDDFDEVQEELTAFDPADAIERDLSIPQALEPILLKALAAHPANRYPTASEFLDDLTDHVFEDRIRISSHDLAAFVARLEATVTAQVPEDPAHPGDLPSLTLEVLADVSTEEPLELEEEDDEDDDDDEVTQKRRWAFPAGSTADIFPPVPDQPACTPGKLLELLADGVIGFETLVRFEGYSWCCLGECQKETRKDDGESNVLTFGPMDLRRNLRDAILQDPGCLVCLWHHDEAIGLTLTRGSLSGLAGTHTGGDLLDLLQARGKLSPVQVMVIRHLAQEDEGRAADALVTRQLVDPAALEALTLERMGEVLDRVLGWPTVSMVVTPLDERPEALSGHGFDELLAEAVRNHVSPERLVEALSPFDGSTVHRDPDGPRTPAFSLERAEAALLDPAVEGQTLGRLRTELVWDSPTEAYRAVLLLLQFGMLTLRG